jgi:hypothetical protein
MSRDSVRRVIAFVVDDLSMSFQSMHYVRMALKKYVENEMQPGNLISIFAQNSRRQEKMNKMRMF